MSKWHICIVWCSRRLTLLFVQASVPFSEKSKAYIAALDTDRDESTLKAHGLHLRPECNQVRKVSNFPGSSRGNRRPQ